MKNFLAKARQFKSLQSLCKTLKSSKITFLSLLTLRARGLSCQPALIKIVTQNWSSCSARLEEKCSRREKGKGSGPGLWWVSFFPIKLVCVNKWSCSWHSCYVTKTEADQGAVCWCIQSSSYHINWISTDIFWFIMMQELSSAAQRTQETERLHKAIKTMCTDQISM